MALKGCIQGSPEAAIVGLWPTKHDAPIAGQNGSFKEMDQGEWQPGGQEPPSPPTTLHVHVDGGNEWYHITAGAFPTTPFSRQKNLDQFSPVYEPLAPSRLPQGSSECHIHLATPAGQARMRGLGLQCSQWVSHQTDCSQPGLPAAGRLRCHASVT